MRPGFRWAGVVMIAVAVVLSGVVRAERPDDSGHPAAPELLSETGLYDPATGRIASRNRPFAPQYPLWTDGAEKSRWIYLPEGTAIDATDSDRWVFPVGTRLWKEFAFEGRKIETRMLWRATAEEWVFASYVWNEEQTDARRAPASGIRNHAEVRPGVRYSIPGIADCLACHESGGTSVLGFNPLQLSDDRDPMAPHGQPLSSEALTISRLNEAGLLRPPRPDLVENPPRIQARTPRERAVLGYLSANCGSCHNERGPLAALGLHLQHREGGAQVQEHAFVTTVGISGEYVTPGQTPETSRRIAPGSPEASAVVYRMSSRRPSSQMPPLGTAAVDTEALELIRGWIEQELGR